MTIFRIYASLFLLLAVVSCAEQRSVPMGKPERGSLEFQSALRIGFGSNHPALPREGTQLNLAGKESAMFNLSVDPAADIWRSLQFDTSLQKVIPLDQSLTAWARDYIASRKNELGLDASELVSFSKTLYEPFDNQAYVTFQRQYQNREVRGAFVQLIFTRDASGYRLSEVQNNSYGPITLRGVTDAGVSAQAAIEATGIPDLQAVQQKALIYPQVGADGRYEFRAATEWELQDSEEGERFRVVYDEENQSILSADSNHYHVKQTLTTETFKNSYIEKTVVVEPLAFARVGALTADVNGVVDTADTATTVTLTGVRGAVISRAANATNTVPYSFPLTFNASGTTKVVASTTVDSAALNAYAALLEVNEWVGKFLTAQQAPILASGIPAIVNVTGPRDAPYCNAFFDGSTLNFFLQGAIGNITCVNTALIKDVMYHEWGHALDAQVGIQPGITDAAFSEGIGDINATLATRDPIVGKGFYLNVANSLVRTVANTKTYPPVGDEVEVHTQGEIIGGTFWDLRQNLVALYGVEEGTNRAASLFFKHLLVTDRYLDSYASVLRLDDNDNNLATPSPSYCAINKAFGKHKLTGAVPVEGNNCLDQDQGLKVRIDQDNGDGLLNLFASSFGAETIVMCEGKVTSCDGVTGAVTFTSRTDAVLLANTAKRFYGAQALVKVKAATAYTLISKSAANTVIGKKVLNFRARDKSADLSATFK